ncbi:MAG: regulatory protein RecX [Candidatus Sumerlaeota bacterium]
MRTIASIKAHKSRKEVALVEFDGEESVELRVETITRFHLKKGLQVSDAQWADALRTDAMERCRLQAWKLLSIRLRSRKELERALRQRKYEPAIVEEVLRELEEKKFLDDAAFAKQFAQQRTARKLGPHRIQQELVARGIKREAAAENAVGASNPAEQEATARQLLTKWNRRTKPEDQKKRAQTAAAFLLRRGFDGDLVWKLIREFFSAR